MGISAKYYPMEVEAMWNMSKEDALKIAEGIYRRDYWDKMRCDDHPPPLGLILFDTGVNVGVRRALVWLQETNSWQGYLFRRLEHYAMLSNFNSFGRGWVNRVVALYKEISRG